MIDAFAEILAVVSVACAAAKPFASSVPTTGALPIGVEPAKNVTLPVGALPRLSVSTNATSVKFAFTGVVVGDVMIVEAVAAWVTVSGTAAEVLAL